MVGWLAGWLAGLLASFLSSFLARSLGWLVGWVGGWGGVCCLGVLVGCGGWLCWLAVLVGCVGWLCWFGVLGGCVGWVCWLGVLLGCVAWVCWLVVLVGCVGVGWLVVFWSVGGSVGRLVGCSVFVFGVLGSSFLVRRLSFVVVFPLFCVFVFRPWSFVFRLSSVVCWSLVVVCCFDCCLLFFDWRLGVRGCWLLVGGWWVGGVGGWVGGLLVGSRPTTCFQKPDENVAVAHVSKHQNLISHAEKLQGIFVRTLQAISSTHFNRCTSLRALCYIKPTVTLQTANSRRGPGGGMRFAHESRIAKHESRITTFEVHRGNKSRMTKHES